MAAFRARFAFGAQALVWFLTLAPILPPPVAAAQSEGPFALDGVAAEIDGVRASAVEQAQTEMAFSPSRDGGISLGSGPTYGTLFETRGSYRMVLGQRLSENVETIRHELGAARLTATSVNSSGRILVIVSCGVDPPCVDERAARRPEEPVWNFTPMAGAMQLFPDVRSIRSPPPQWDPRRDYFAAAPRLLSQGADVHGYTGPTRIYFWDLDLRVEWPDGASSTFQAGDRSTDETNPLAPHVIRVLYVEAEVQNLTAAGGTVEQWWTEGALVLARGELLLENVTGRITIGGRPLVLSGDEVRILHGPSRFEVHAPGEWSQSTFPIGLTGDDWSVFVNGERVVWDEESVGPEIVAVSVGLGLLSLATIWLSLFSRRTKATDWAGYQHRTLANGRRAQLYRWVQENPGIQPFHLWQRLGGAFGLTLRSLDRLERVGLVRSARIGKFRHYFDSRLPADPGRMRRDAQLATRTLRETVEALRRLGPCGETRLRAALGVSHATMQGRLTRLMNLGFVKRRWDAGVRFVYFLQEGASAPPTPFTNVAGEPVSRTSPTPAPPATAGA